MIGRLSFFSRSASRDATCSLLEPPSELHRIDRIQYRNFEDEQLANAPLVLVRRMLPQKHVAPSYFIQKVVGTRSKGEKH